MSKQAVPATTRSIQAGPPAPEPPSFCIVGPDDTHELNPAIVEEIEPGQRDAFQVAGHRLQECHGETTRRLVGFALFVLGLDPASQDEAIDVLEKILGEDEKAVEAINQFLHAETASHALSLARERLNRAAFLKARQAELGRLPDGAALHLTHLHAAAGA